MTDKPTLFRSLTTGQTLTREDLIECDECDGTGWVDRVYDASPTPCYTRWIFDEDPCPTCGGPGLLEGYGIPPGLNYAPRRVVAIEEVVHG